MDSSNNQIPIPLSDKPYFESKNGFGEYKNDAIELLSETIKILDEFNINYFLISGTLLGHVRHNGFIPWDDDIDIIVDQSILVKLPLIFKKYQHKFVFINKENFLIKLCFKNKVSRINKNCFNRYLLNPFDKYNWPFIDLFIYTEKQIQINPFGQSITALHFFMKNWNKSAFFPPLKVNFEGIENVCIPAIPHYFLKINYGDKYMTTFISSSYNHREETKIYTVKRIDINENTQN
jgi:phosphorylcholine metabolism protein LicD